jgi:hypothetical protein
VSVAMSGADEGEWGETFSELQAFPPMRKERNTLSSRPTVTTGAWVGERWRGVAAVRSVRAPPSTEYCWVLLVRTKRLWMAVKSASLVTPQRRCKVADRAEPWTSVKVFTRRAVSWASCFAWLFSRVVRT